MQHRLPLEKVRQYRNILISYPNRAILVHDVSRSLSPFAAVAARAPRKSVGVPRPVCSPSPSGRSKKGKSVIGGNPARLWGTPEWQKGIGVSSSR